jgi:hypothetical protein
MERAAAVVGAVQLIKPRQYVVIDMSGERSTIDFDAPDHSG